MENLIALLIAAPLLGAAVLLVGGRRLDAVGHWIGTLLSSTSFVLGVILFADLPLVNGDDVAELVATPGQIVIAPDQNRAGTNGLLLRRGPVELSEFAFRFGVGSFAAHVAEARQLGIEPAIVDLPGLGFDLDTPDDLGNLISLDSAFMSRLRETGS